MENKNNLFALESIYKFIRASKDDVRFEPKALQAGLNRYCNGVKYL